MNIKEASQRKEDLPTAEHLRNNYTQSFMRLTAAYNGEYQMQGKRYICPDCRKKVPEIRTHFSDGSVKLNCKTCGQERSYETWRFDPAECEKVITARLQKEIDEAEKRGQNDGKEQSG